VNRESKLGVSILILSYNHVEFIERSVRSVFEQRESVKNIELILLDDGSTDGTQELLKKLQQTAPIPMELILKDHEGVHSISKNLNTLITHANKKYIAFLASDDFYLPNRFQKQIIIMEANDSVQLVYGNGTNLLNGEPISDTHPTMVIELLKSRNPKKIYEYITSGTSQLYIQAVLIRSEFVRDFKPFNEDLIADDWVFNIQCFKRLIDFNLSFSSINDKLFVRNVLLTSTSNNVPVHFKRVAQTAEIYIDSSNKVFYKKFYWNYSKLFLRRGYFKSSVILLGRLCFLGFSFHNRKLSSFI
jgi:glycosyltransferase involved in cell wall biosynthesis